jgi:hypothetical protein
MISASEQFQILKHAVASNLEFEITSHSEKIRAENLNSSFDRIKFRSLDIVFVPTADWASRTLTTRFPTGTRSTVGS